MQFIYDLFFEATSGDDDWRIFNNDWYDTVGRHRSDTEELEWILKNPEISNDAKQALIKVVSEKNSELEKEERILYKIGDTPKEHAESIRETEEDIVEWPSRMRKALFIGAAVFLLIDLFIILYYRLYATLGPVRILSTFLFGFAVAFLTESWESTEGIKTSKDRAIRFEDARVGNRLQERIAAIEEEKQALYELSKVIIRSGVEKSQAEPQ